jgi:hypothetical protein
VRGREAQVGKLTNEMTHRAITLAVMIVVSLLLLALMLLSGIATMGGQGWLALAVVVVASAIAGIAFSWRRYFPRRR